MLETGQWQCHTIPKGPPSSSVANDLSICIISVLSIVFEHRFVSDDLKNAVVCFHPPSLIFGKIWVPVINFCVIVIVHDFRAAIDRIKHLGILYKLCFEYIGGLVLSILIQFLVTVVSEVPQESVLGPLLCLLYTAMLFSILDNKLKTTATVV